MNNDEKQATINTVSTLLFKWDLDIVWKDPHKRPLTVRTMHYSFTDGFISYQQENDKDTWHFLNKDEISEVTITKVQSL